MKVSAAYITMLSLLGLLFVDNANAHLMGRVEALP